MLPPSPPSRTAPAAARATRHVALLRGLNVGGKNRLAMADLQTIFEAAGAAGVATVQVAGNVLFDAPAGRVKAIVAAVDAALSRRGLGSVVVLRTADELQAAAADHPFLAIGAEPERCYVAFLSTRPTPAAAAGLDPGRSPPDAFEVRGREVYLWLPNGAAKTRITTGWLDARLGTLSTVRGWATVLTLARKLAP
jgi:uncharacterized protein (DUF1697 family)